MRVPGRPKDHDKGAAIIAAAQDLFRQRGYEGVTMEAVAAAAGVAKMTVYGHFHDKAALFEATIRAKGAEMLAGLADLPAVSGRLEETLTRFGQAFMTMVLAPDMAAIMPLLIVAVAKERGLAARFYEAGPGHTRQALAGFLKASAARAELTLANAEDAADDLLSLWLGDMPMRLALGLIGSLGPAEIEQRARRGVEVFLRAYVTCRATPASEPRNAEHKPG
jgi:TetR/AcrR family transcriptional repressor of mexJK operon